MTTSSHFGRLSPLDASFLALEDNDTPMHVGSLGIYEAEAFRNPEGGLDFERIELHLSQLVPANPRLHQKVWRPLGGAPLWIDDERFDTSYHFRRTRLPSPGGIEELRSLCGRVLSTRLDTTRPLWEAWIIEGIEGDRFALLWKIHHSMTDGIGVREILTGYLGFAPNPDVPKPIAYAPRRKPSLAELLRDEAEHRISLTRDLSARLGELVRGSGSLPETLGDAANGVVQTATSLLTRPSPTPLNQPIGPHRRFDWTQVSFRELSDIRKHTKAKVNDIALAVVAGAMRRFFLGRDIPVDDLNFTVMVPVNVRKEGDSGTGNHVSNMSVPLPLAETDPKRRLQKTMAAAARAKSSGQSKVGDTLALAADWAGLRAPASLARFAAARVAANLVVTNIPGPMFPQYLGEAKLLAAPPIVPLSTGQGLGIALYGYNNELFWGFNADRDLMPDLHDLVAAVDAEMTLLHRAYEPVEIKRHLRTVEKKTKPPVSPTKRSEPEEQSAPAAGVGA